VREIPTSRQALRSEIGCFVRIAATASRLACGVSITGYSRAQCLGVEQRLGQRLLEPAVLRLELAQSLGLVDAQAAVRLASRVERGVTETKLAAQPEDRRASLGRLQVTEDLLPAESLFFMPVFSFENGLYSAHLGTEYWGHIRRGVFSPLCKIQSVIQLIATG